MSAAEAVVEPWIPSRRRRIGSGPSCRPGHRSWRPRCAATWCNSPRSSPRAASMSPTARCVSSPAGSTDSTDVTVVADITRSHFEDYKVWLAAQPGTKAPTLAKNTQRQRLRMIRIFFERLIEWDWPDAPRRNPILHGDIPPRPEPLPKFLDDRDAAR